MKSIEKLILSIVLLTVFSWILQPVVGFITDSLYSDHPFWSSLALPRNLPSVFVNMCVSIWLYIQTRKKSEMKPLLWALLGLFFGMISLVIFLIVDLRDTKTGS